MADDLMKGYSKARKSLGYAKNKDKFHKGFQSPPSGGKAAPDRAKGRANVPIPEMKRAKTRPARKS